VCGFLGIFAPQQLPLDRGREAYYQARAKNLAHRGNSSQGSEFQSHHALYHYRLAFRDLVDGQQPLTDSLGRATILFNGELYGFQALRDRLKSTFAFQTRSDTEVILAAYLEYGLELLHEIDGEFAFVILDHRTGAVVAARDGYGVKPLFFGSGDASPAKLLRQYQPTYSFSLRGHLQFASEIKGLAFPIRWDAEGHNRAMVSLYEELATSFQGVFAMAPGSILLAEPRGDRWEIHLQRKISNARHREQFSLVEFPTRAEELGHILARNVELKLDSDVPLGAYLSGGIDSRIAAYEMSKRHGTIETFTVGFQDADYDETPQVSQFLQAHKNLRGRALKTNPEALEYSYPHAIYASELVQPYTNGAAKWWLAKFARRYVRGVLTGDGADEIFCGYPSYRYAAWWKFYQKNPTAARARLFAERVVGKQEKFWEKGLSSYPDGSDLQASLQNLGWIHPLFAQIQSLAKLHFPSASEDFFQAEKTRIGSYLKESATESPLTQWQNYFFHTHFPTHILNWVGDRMEMANTLEGRPIFLSKEIRAFMQASPDHHLVRGMRDKAILRKAYAEKLGNFSRSPKKQFNAPFQLEGKLAREFLSDAALRESGLFQASQIQSAKDLFLSADPLQKSFAQIYLQNCLVSQMLHRFFVLDQAPVRNASYEENFIDQHTVNL
jgi:asparagine synthase (glutamine-hydrolysing)